MRIMLISGTGFIGGHVAAALIARGHELWVLDEPGSDLARALRALRPDAVCCQPFQRTADERAELSVRDACMRAGVERLVLATTAGRPAALVPGVEHGLRTTELRYANVYGPGEDPELEPGVVATFVHRMLRDEPIRINARSRRGDDGCVRDYVFVHDVVRANIAAIEDHLPFDSLHVASGEPTSTRELAEQIRRSCGSRSSICYASRRPDDPARRVLDATRLRTICSPTGLGAGLAATISWYVERYAPRAARTNRRAPSNSTYFIPSIAGD
jgi:UDP-glucose 4-epimerase